MDHKFSEMFRQDKFEKKFADMHGPGGASFAQGGPAGGFPGGGMPAGPVGAIPAGPMSPAGGAPGKQFRQQDWKSFGLALQKAEHATRDADKDFDFKDFMDTYTQNSKDSCHLEILRLGIAS